MSGRQLVLLVEDDAELRRMFRQALALEGFEVREAGDGLEALRWLDVEVPDAVILDLQLPIISGLTVREELAAQAHLRHIPVIIVTGQEGPYDSLDAACVLRKPVATHRLVEVVRSCIASGGAFPRRNTSGMV